jgi:peptide deformylase
VAIRPILLYPDPILKQRSAAVSLSDPGIAGVIQDMLDSLAASPGVALAAPQIAYPLRVIVVDVSRKKGEHGHGLLVLLNPQILQADVPRITREGCLSVPDFTGNVQRYDEVIVDGMTQEGKRTVLSVKGFEALAFQHEIDHLEGVLFLDRIQSLSTDLFRRGGSNAAMKPGTPGTQA